MGQIIRLIDSFTKENVNYEEVTTWHDGTAMDDSKVDNVIYRKKGEKYYWRIYDGVADVRWFGAVGDGITDDTAALQAAINTGNIRLHRNSEYIISKSLICNEELTLSGENSTIKIKDNTRIENGMLIAGANSKKIIIKNVAFNENAKNMPVYQASEYGTVYNTAFRCEYNNADITITGCKFLDGYNIQMFFTQTARNLTIRDNYFQFNKHAGKEQNQHATNIWLLTIASVSKILIENNKFDNKAPSQVQYGTNAIFLAGVNADTVIRNNYINNCGRDNTGSHRLYPIDFYGDCRNIKVIDNYFDNCQYGFFRMNTCDNIVVKNNTLIHNSLSPVVGEPGFAISSTNTYPDKKSSNIIISKNNIIIKTRIIVLFYTYHYNWQMPTESVDMSDNVIEGYTNNVLKFDYGCKNISLCRNTIKESTSIGRAPSALVSASMPQGVTVGDITTAKTENIAIKDNICKLDGGVIFSSDATNYSGRWSPVIIMNNVIEGVKNQSHSVIKETELVFDNNIVKTMKYVLEVIGSKLVIIRNNVVNDVSVADYKKDTATNFIINNNILNGSSSPNNS